MNYSALVASMGQIGREFNEKSSTQQLLWRMVTKCVSKLGLLDFIIYTYDKDKELLSQEAGFGFKTNTNNEILNPIKVRKGKGIVGDAAQKMKFQLVEDTSLDNRYIVDGRENKSELSVPITWNGKLLGVLDSEHPNTNFFKDLHVDAFYMMSSFLGPRLERLQVKKKPIPKQNRYYKQFIQLLEEKQLYRNDQLSLDTVSDYFNINKCYLSKVINQASDQKFTDIVNRYRVEDVKDALQKGKHKRYTILSLAYDAGFSSKAGFNAAFKKNTGKTPSQFIHSTLRN